MYTDTLLRERFNLTVHTSYLLLEYKCLSSYLVVEMIRLLIQELDLSLEKGGNLAGICARTRCDS